MVDKVAVNQNLKSYLLLKLWLEVAVYIVIVILLYALNFWFVILAPVIFFPITIGIISVIFFTDRKKAMLVAGLSALIGTMINTNFMTVTNLINHLNYMNRPGFDGGSVSRFY